MTSPEGDDTGCKDINGSSKEQQTEELKYNIALTRALVDLNKLLQEQLCLKSVHLKKRGYIRMYLKDLKRIDSLFCNLFFLISVQGKPSPSRSQSSVTLNLHVI